MKLLHWFIRPTPQELIDGLKHESARVRRNAIAGLREIKPFPEDAVPALFESLQDDDPGVRAPAAGLLLETMPKAYEFPRVVSGPFADFKGEVVLALSRSRTAGGPDVRTVAEDLVKSTMPEDDVLRACMGAQPHDKIRYLISRLCEVLARACDSAHANAATFLCYAAHEERVRSAVVRILADDPDDGVRLSVVLSHRLSEIFRYTQPGHAMMTRVLGSGLVNTWLSTEDGAERDKTAAALEGYGRAGVYALIAALKGSGGCVPACGSLGRMGAVAREAIPILADLLEDKDPERRASAADALKAITGEGLGRNRREWHDWWRSPRGKIILLWQRARQSLR